MDILACSGADFAPIAPKIVLSAAVGHVNGRRKKFSVGSQWNF